MLGIELLLLIAVAISGGQGTLAGNVTTLQPTACDPTCIDHYRNCEPKAIGLNSDKPKEVVNCSENYFQLRCPVLCELCTPCSFVIYEELDNITDVINNVVNHVIIVTETPKQVVCNPCTETKSIDSAGNPFCEKKWFTTEWTEGTCDNYCGIGQSVATRSCVYYLESVGGQCDKVSTDTDSDNPCDDAVLKYSMSCFDRVCNIQAISQSTGTSASASSESEFSFQLYTHRGEVCDLGVLGVPADRSDGRYKYYDLYGEPRSQCNASMGAFDEPFEYVKITMTGTDDWELEQVTVTVNGNTQPYNYQGFVTQEHPVVELKAY